MKKTYEQTANDMDARFASGGFAGAGGNMQSLTFAYAALTRVLNDSPIKESLSQLGHWTSEDNPDGSCEIRGLRAEVRDYGCAEGDGTAALSYFFPLSRIVGIDISPVAIDRARERWPHLSFRVGDIRTPEPEHVSIIFVSHTIEHMEDPAAVIQNLLGLCSVLIVVVPPVDGKPRGEAHVGAKRIREWTAKLPDPLYETYYNSLRPDIEGGGVIHEGNVLFVWKGS
ncbi:MAG: class I SAM-dependent methyltransferase, partial [Planctomycetota bacterium]|jgi:SAM-dependent methyltransferase